MNLEKRNENTGMSITLEIMANSLNCLESGLEC